MKKLLTLIILSILIVTNAGKSHAEENSSGSSAVLLSPLAIKSLDNRVKILGEFLKQYNSPLEPHAVDFVKYADKYKLDWKLVAAISGLESTFGKAIPYNSYNGWGWGIYGDNMIRFSSWTEGIKTVSEGLRENYINKWGAQDVYMIGRFYASSPTWASRVTYFMEKIDEFKSKQLASNLSISL
ncbi:MAG: hypothetical protein A3D74_04740 [Candidatus Levybacteria bacterium RIFCSPHIGHO2_02_FULL_37_13]|nr:MAG: hypothetical protein A3D74_04740 [Candidatus Levybacteria bacterium RIFCSPHIGHO2_02_FULL_37_13]OGH29438.1 MAG: hypothetical protein A3E40_01780 [Candidatus Levybacteria bacterium RIFCSPHIGHO2_12_FULL_37_9]OGH39429.1 MAG: hypothetical protein A3B41_02455 [Candidatus Levybacteria bacterium RIFCSPLOWO2_01_FULL_37_26]